MPARHSACQRLREQQARLLPVPPDRAIVEHVVHAQEVCCSLIEAMMIPREGGYIAHKSLHQHIS